MKKILAVLCGCMMIMLAACGGKNSTTDETKGAVPTATVTSEPTEVTATPAKEPTAEPNAEPVKQPTAEPTAEPTAVVVPTEPIELPEIPTAAPSAEPTTSIALPTPTQAVEVTPVPDPIRDDDTISAEDFLNRFGSLAAERSVSRVNELKERFDGRTILEDRPLYVVYLDLETLPGDGFTKCDAWEEDWYRWDGNDENFKLFRGITMTGEEYEAGVLEIEVRESAAYGSTPGANSAERSAYWLYFRNADAVDLYDFTIYCEGVGEDVDPTGVTTNVELYYRQFTDRLFDLVFEVERREAASEDGKTYRVSTHTSVLGTMSDLHDVEYYVDTIVKECDNAEDSSKAMETVDFTIVDWDRGRGAEEETNLARGTLAVGSSRKVAGESEQEIEAAALDLVRSTVALSGYTFEQMKDGDVYTVRFGDGIDVIAFKVTIGLTSVDGEQSVAITEIKLG